MTKDPVEVYQERMTEDFAWHCCANYTWDEMREMLSKEPESPSAEFLVDHNLGDASQYYAGIRYALEEEHKQGGNNDDAR